MCAYKLHANRDLDNNSACKLGVTLFVEPVTNNGLLSLYRDDVNDNAGECRLDNEC